MLIENTFSYKVAFLFILAALIAERLQNTFSRKYKNAKSYKIFHVRFFFILLAAYLAIVVISCYSFLTAKTFNLFVSNIGALIFVVGVILRRSAINALGDYWSVFIEIKKNQKVVKEGLYKYIKHPYYTAVLLELSGFALICNSYLAMILIALVQLPLVFVRIHYENRILNIFGKRLNFK